jgi:hypothetical protein
LLGRIRPHDLTRSRRSLGNAAARQRRGPGGRIPSAAAAGRGDHADERSDDDSRRHVCRCDASGGHMRPPLVAVCLLVGHLHVAD